MAQTLNAVFLKYGPATDTRLSIIRQCTVSAVWYDMPFFLSTKLPLS